MKAAWYERQGAARDVLVVGDIDNPQPHAGEVRIRIALSGVNPGDVKKREDALESGCRIHVSFHTVTVRAQLMQFERVRISWIESAISKRLIF